MKIQTNKLKKNLLIDDVRFIEYGTTVRSGEIGIEFLKKSNWDVLYLDHDMGLNVMTGYDVMCWLEENPIYLPKQIIVVSSNPVGRMNMQVVIDKFIKKGIIKNQWGHYEKNI